MENHSTAKVLHHEESLERQDQDSLAGIRLFQIYIMSSNVRRLGLRWPQSLIV